MLGWLNVVLPGGKGSLLLYNLYADESYSTKEGNLSVCGYLIGSKALPFFTEKWAEALGPLPYFHMSEGHHKSHPDIYRKLLRLISCDHFVAAFSATVHQRAYRDVMRYRLHGHPALYWFGGAYSFCVSAIADLANRWLNANNPGEKDMAYIFEAGDGRRGEADWALQMFNSDPYLVEMKRRIRYFSHVFVDGKRKEAGALQAADILAWHVVKSDEGTRPPDDVREALLAVRCYQVYYTADDLRSNLQENLKFNELYKSLKGAKKFKFSPSIAP